MSAPSLTVRAFASLLALPGYEQLRVLHEQKYPKQQPQTFRTPFYLPALSGIRDFYRLGNNDAALAVARQQIDSLGLEARRDSNRRVLDAFETSNQYMRQLRPSANHRRSAMIGKVELRLGLDLCADEGGTVRYLYYNCRVASMDYEIARVALELAHWVLEENGVAAPIATIEVVDFAGHTTHRARSRRPRTLNRARQTGRVISTLWPTL